MEKPMVFFDTDPMDQARLLQRFPGAIFHPALKEPRAIVQACGDAKVVCTFINTKFTREIIAQLPSLQLLCTRSVGYDHIDLLACQERGIVVCHVPDYGSHVIAEHVFALLLSTVRHISTATERVQAGVFDYHGLRGMALRGKTIGIMGTGKIGSHVAKIAHGFSMTILATDRCRNLELEQAFGVRYVPLETLLRESDIVSLHLPLTEGTKGIINAAAIAQMRSGVIIVNTARGALIHGPDLLWALESGKVRYALLDVLTHEGRVELDAPLTKHPNVVVTPHIAFYADDSVTAMYEDVFQSIDQWSRGEVPDHMVKVPAIICDLPAIAAQAGAGGAPA